MFESEQQSSENGKDDGGWSRYAGSENLRRGAIDNLIKPQTSYLKRSAPQAERFSSGAVSEEQL
jgi:hypothetical protein